MSDQANKPFGKMLLIDWFRNLPRDLRDEILAPAGTDSNFVNKKLFTYNYEQNPAFRFHTAVGIDKASHGVIDFRDLTMNCHEIDWEYVRKALNHRTKKLRDLGQPVQPITGAE
jgi:hypothetical protein